MSDSFYQYQNIINDTTLSEVVIKSLPKFNTLQSDLFSVETKYSEISIPIKIYELLNELCESYKLSDVKDELLTLLAFSQEKYLIGKDSLDEEMQLDQNFIDLNTDLTELFKHLKKYIFSTDNNNIRSINFKVTDNNLTVKNFFVIQDIYDSIINFYGFRKENFDQKSDEVLSANNTLGILYKSEHFKTSLIHFLYDYLIDKDFTQSSCLRFIGVFLHLSQIPANNNSPIEIFDDLKSNEELVDIKNLRHYVTRK